MTPYHIIATLGPASADEATWQAMLRAGATGFRLNTSHLTLEALSRWLDRLTPFLEMTSPTPPLTLDLQGSKWRIGQVAAVELVEGQRVELIYADAASTPNALPVPHADFFNAAVGAETAGGEIVLNDAKIRLVIESAALERVSARVTLGGPVSSHKGITLPGTAFRAEALSAKDAAIFETTRSLHFIRYAISYLKDADEMAVYRAGFGPKAYLAAKIERGTALAHLPQLFGYANELWVCRGDLGAELGLRPMAESVARVTAQLSSLPIPVIMAGQVLEHMTASPTPTRSEVCYLYDALQAGYHGFVLSDEAAVGQYPVESCRAAAIWMGEGGR